MPNDDTVDLSTKAAQAAGERRQLDKPRDFNHWVIPAACIATAILWILSAINVAEDKPGPHTLTQNLLVIGTWAMTSLTILYIKDYVLHRAMSRDHAALHAEIEELRALVLEARGRLIVAASENRTLLEQISTKQDLMAQLYWENFANEALGKASGAAVLPFSRTPRQR